MNLSKIIIVLSLASVVVLLVVNRDLIMGSSDAHSGGDTTCAHENHQHHQGVEKKPNVEGAQSQGHHGGEGAQNAQPFYQGEVVSVEHGGGYTYLEIKERTDLTFWVALERAEVKVGDFVRFQKEMVAKNFKSKALNITFDEIMFASHLQHKVKKSE